MRIKTDYMGNDQLLPAYNVQIGVADEYIAVVDVNHYRSDMDCFVPLMEHFKQTYGFYPKYPVADAGYGSYNNYIFCEQNGICRFLSSGKVNIFSIVFSSIFYSINILYQYWSGRFM